jgi:hypothetical protein
MRRRTMPSDASGKILTKFILSHRSYDTQIDR